MFSIGWSVVDTISRSRGIKRAGRSLTTASFNVRTAVWTAWNRGGRGVFKEGGAFSRARLVQLSILLPTRERTSSQERPPALKFSFPNAGQNRDLREYDAIQLSRRESLRLGRVMRGDNRAHQRDYTASKNTDRTPKSVTSLRGGPPGKELSF
jgi:hypothetical protein